MHSVLFLNKTTNCLESPNAHCKFHSSKIGYIIILWLKHQAEFDISVQFVMLQ